VPRSLEDDPQKIEGTERSIREHTAPKHRKPDQVPSQKEEENPEERWSPTVASAATGEPFDDQGNQPDPEYGGITASEKAALTKRQHVLLVEPDSEKVKGAEKFMKEHVK
jgi:hypothetical protein